MNGVCAGQLQACTVQYSTHSVLDRTRSKVMMNHLFGSRGTLFGPQRRPESRWFSLIHTHPPLSFYIYIYIYKALNVEQ